MNRKSTIVLCVGVLLTAGLLTPVFARVVKKPPKHDKPQVGSFVLTGEGGQEYHKWVEFTIVRITEPAPGARVPISTDGAPTSVTLRCVPAIDVDINTPCTHPEQFVDDSTFTWSADGGSFTDDSGTEATWVAPFTVGPVKITVMVNDDLSPVYANDTNRDTSITLEVIGSDNVYVNPTAPGPVHNGLSWTTAYQSLDTGLTNAPVDSNVWVAEGTYTPVSVNGFWINKNLRIYGGFAATETALDQRDWVAHPTILSGAYVTNHVVRFTSVALLDGFTIKQGRGAADGAGAYIDNCSPTIQNCLFTDNYTSTSAADGGAIHCMTSSPTVIGCTFTNNTAGDDGGAVCNKHDSDGKYINCAFYYNYAQGLDGEGGGGAIYNAGNDPGLEAAGSSPSFVNCVMATNTSARYGGGMCTSIVAAPVSSPVVTNCTFYGNAATSGGDAIASNDSNPTTVANSILWNNSGDATTDDILGNITVTYSDVQGSVGGAGNISLDPQFVKTTNPVDLVGPDNRWLTCDDGLRLKFSSPCVDEANGDAKDAVTEAGANERDALGLKHIDIRTVGDGGTGTPAWYDMGAYEAAVEHVIFVSVDGLAATYLQHGTLMGTAGNLPNFDKIASQGLWTFNARSDPCCTETTPNHLEMLTGRPVYQPEGMPATTQHNTNYNGAFVDETMRLHKYQSMGWDNDPETGDPCEQRVGNPNLSYIASVYDVVHDRGGTTAEYAGKDKFIIHEWSWDLDHGRADLIAPDNSRDKIDTFEWTQDGDCGDPGNRMDYNSDVLMSKFINNGVAEYPFNFVFFHFKGPDKVGHNSLIWWEPQGPWDSPGWDDIVKTVDGHLETMMDLVTTPSNKGWYYNTVIIVTADHGGGGNPGGYSHDKYKQFDNYDIPFGVWGHLVPPGDAYGHSGNTRFNPGGAQVLFTATQQPIRHADGVDLALNLMGLPAIPGALITGMSIR